MDADRIRKVADAIEKDGGQGFYMGRVGEPECGTAGCIAGFACWEAVRHDWMADTLLGDRVGLNQFVQRGGGRQRFAAHVLGLNTGEADLLFTPENGHARWNAWSEDPAYVTADRAVAVLRHLADHGVIDWTVGLPDTPAVN